MPRLAGGDEALGSAGGLDTSGPGEAAEKRMGEPVRAKVQHPFLYVKRHFRYAKVRIGG